MGINETIKLAMIGAGSMAREHLRAFADLPNVSLAGIYSRTRSRAEALAQEFNIPLVCDSIAELYEQTQAHVVVVTVFETSMKSVAIDCLQFPWNVFLEKPPGIDFDEAQTINNIAQANGRRIFVGLNRRFLSSTRAVYSDLQTSQEPRYIHVQDQQNFVEARGYGHPDVVINNWMYANSIHLIDYLRLLGRGAVKSVTPVIPWRGESSQIVIAKIEFASGDTGLYEGIWDGPGPWAVSVSRAGKRWEMRPLEQATYQMQGQRQRISIDISSWDTEFKPGFRLQAEMLAQAVRNEPSEIPTLGEALETMGLIRAIFTS